MQQQRSRKIKDLYCSEGEPSRSPLRTSILGTRNWDLCVQLSMCIGEEGRTAQCLRASLPPSLYLSLYYIRWQLYIARND